MKQAELPSEGRSYFIDFTETFETKYKLDLKVRLYLNYHCVRSVFSILSLKKQKYNVYNMVYNVMMWLCLYLVN